MNSIFNHLILTKGRPKKTSKNEVIFMTKEELHKMIEQDQPNICQIEAIHDGKTVTATPGIITRATTAFTLCL